MRIAMFTDTYTPQVNGVVTSIRTFATELERRGHQVHIWAPVSRIAAERNVHRIASFTFAPYPEYKISVPTPKILQEFGRTLPDIVHVHTPISMGTVGISLARHFSLPVVGTFHTLLPEYMHYLVKRNLGALLKPAQRLAWDWCVWFYNHCDAVIAPSSAIAALLKEKGVKVPIYVIPTGIPKPHKVGASEVTALRKKFGLKGKVLLHVGRVTREKNIEAIIDSAFGIDAMLAIASDGPHRKSLQQYVRRKGLEDRVRFLGYLPKQELDAAYAAADLFVCASRSETQGIVLLEAAAAGLPIVALDAPVVSDFVKENGVGVVASSEEFADAIAAALCDDALRKRVRSRSKAIARKYDIARCTKALLGVYSRTKNELAH